VNERTTASLHAHNEHQGHCPYCADLLAENARLTEELMDFDTLAALQRHREQPYIARWQEETGKGDLVHPDYGEFLQWLIERLEALERRR
jgi:hypothetical protein